jgi:hypothetical protein
MLMRSQALAVVVGTVALSLSAALPAPVPAAGAAARPVAHWSMNERAGAAVMVDASGHRLHGRIGSAVRVGTDVAGALGGRAYRWRFTRPHAPPVKPQRLVRVPDRPRLDPGTRRYAVTIRFRTTQEVWNLVQKGQSNTPGGYWKIEGHRGEVVCVFRGAASGKAVSSKVGLSDGRWHTVRCARTARRVTMTVDAGTRSQITRRARGVTGRIANPYPLTIGGKVRCNQTTVTCDYFSGDVDYVTIQAG